MYEVYRCINILLNDSVAERNNAIKHFCHDSVTFRSFFPLAIKLLMISIRSKSPKIDLNIVGKFYLKIARHIEKNKIEKVHYNDPIFNKLLSIKRRRTKQSHH
jgi:hypothetical protein